MMSDGIRWPPLVFDGRESKSPPGAKAPDQASPAPNPAQDNTTQHTPAIQPSKQAHRVTRIRSADDSTGTT